MRLDRWLTTLGMGSRSEVQRLIRSGAVTVAGETVRDPGMDCATEVTPLRVRGESVDGRTVRHVMLHKPEGLLTAARDRKQPTVMDMLPMAYAAMGCMPVGRLDKDTEGLLLITDDGALNHSLLAPGRHVPKTYYARIHGIVTESDITAFKNGLDIGEKKMTAPAALKILHIAENEQTSEILVTITEGKFHQVKRMFQSVGKKVSYLKRLSMGSLHLDEKLTPGAWRELTLEEITKLKEETI